MDTYANFAELEKHEQAGKDYLIVYRKADSKFCILAPHGGGIEPATSTIADAIASGDREWAEAAMRSHVLVSRSMTLTNFPEN